MNSVFPRFVFLWIGTLAWLFPRTLANGVPQSSGIYTFELCGGRCKCSKDPEYLGFNNKTCADGVPPRSDVYGNTVGPILRETGAESNRWRWWNVTVTSNSNGSAFGVIKNTYPSGKGKPRCVGYYMTDYYRYRNKKACRELPWAARVHLHKSSHPWQLVPVPNTDCFNIIDGGKPKICLRYLSASSTCSDRYMHLTLGDDGSGLQRWRIRSYPLSPPTKSPSPSPNSPSPTASPSPSPPATSRNPSVVAVSASGPQTGTVVFQPTPGASSCDVALILKDQPAMTYTITALSYPNTVFYPVNLKLDSKYTVNLKCTLPTGPILTAPSTYPLVTAVGPGVPAVINFIPTSSTSGNLTVVAPDPGTCKATSYTVDVKPADGNGPSFSVNSSSTLVSIPGMTAGTAYQVSVQASCQGGGSSKPSSSSFITPSNEPVPPAPLPSPSPETSPPPGKSPSPATSPSPPPSVVTCTTKPGLEVVAVSGSLVTVNVKVPPPIANAQVLIGVGCDYKDGTQGGADTGGWIPASYPVTSLQVHIDLPGKCEIVTAVQKLGQIVPVLCPVVDGSFEILATDITPGVQNIQPTSSSTATLQVVAPKIGCANMTYTIRVRPDKAQDHAIEFTIGPNDGSTATLKGLSANTQYSVTVTGTCPEDKHETPESTAAIFNTPCDVALNYLPTPVNGTCFCASGYQQLNGACVQSRPCPIGQYRNATSNACTKCSPLPGCATVSCQSATTSICTICNAGLTLDKKTGQCVGSCGPGSFLDGTVCKNCTSVTGCLSFSVSCISATSSKCSKCMEGHYLDSAGLCSKCAAISNCDVSLTCSSAVDSVCSKCATGYYGNQCFDCPRPAGCTDTSKTTCSSNNDTKCDACSPGYYSTDGRCAPCTTATINGCIKYSCSSATASTCTACSPLFDLSSAGACDAKPPCPAGQYRSPADGSCAPCASAPVDHCARSSCTSSADSVCVACDASYTLNGTACVPGSPIAPACSDVTLAATFASPIAKPVDFLIKLPDCSTTMTTATCISNLNSNPDQDAFDLNPGCKGYIILCSRADTGDSLQTTLLGRTAHPSPGQMTVEAEYLGASTNEYGINTHFNKAGKQLTPDYAACGSITPPFNTAENSETPFLGPCPDVGGGLGRVALPPSPIVCT